MKSTRSSVKQTIANDQQLAKDLLGLTLRKHRFVFRLLPTKHVNQFLGL